ncbi:transposable element Tcb2 transposase [Trichonephila clavipes]|uniref:Transposable element Tcb2 transposase n=1 Tax=Trichonephila clavipes TaxID=2585209 RepID=A0A8X6V9A4_TRICX|nr:transposable element Tcb2 transposase [Trichonephila clavipes]
MILHSPTENSLAVLNHKILEANSQVQNVKLGIHQTCLSINRLWHELCGMLRCLVGTTTPDIMIVQFRNEKVSNHGSIPITIDCNVVAFIVSEEGFHQNIKRTKHSVYHSIIERDRYGGRCVLIWGGIMLEGAMGLQFLFMYDNAPCHRTIAAEPLLESEDIERMDWPARSPDLNLIEHVWDFLGRRFSARTLPPVTIRELRLGLQDEWAAMPQQLIDTLILSMGKRCETCLAVREIISITKDRMFLAGHPSQGCFWPSVALRSMLLFQPSFYLSL